MYRLRCSSRVRKVMRLGSGRERRRCIMQFSLAAGSERAVRERKKVSDLIMVREPFNFCPHLFQLGNFKSLIKLKEGPLMTNTHFLD